MASSERIPADFYGPPGHLRIATADADVVARARGVRWPDGRTHPAKAPQLRRGRDAPHTYLRLDPHTAPGDYVAILDLADGSQREIMASVTARHRLRLSPGSIRLIGAPGESVSVRLLAENLGNVDIQIPETLVAGVFDDDGIETAFASTYRLETDELNKIVANMFARLRDAHGGVVHLKITEGAGVLAPGGRRFLMLSTTLNSKLKRGHGYHGVVDIGSYSMRIEINAGERVSAQGA